MPRYEGVVFTGRATHSRTGAHTKKRKGATGPLREKKRSGRGRERSKLRAWKNFFRLPRQPVRRADDDERRKGLGARKGGKEAGVLGLVIKQQSRAKRKKEREKKSAQVGGGGNARVGWENLKAWVFIGYPVKWHISKGENNIGELQGRRRGYEEGSDLLITGRYVVESNVDRGFRRRERTRCRRDK